MNDIVAIPQQPELELQALRSRLARMESLFWNRPVPARIVVLGAGYAGLTCDLGLRGLAAEVTLVNRNDYHYLTTLLHEPAVGRRDFSEVTVDLPSLLEGSEVRLLKAETTAIDLERQTVTVAVGEEARELPYDFLVVALGSQPEFYHIPGLEQHALTLSSWSEAKRLHLRVEESLINFKDHPDEPWRAHIVVGGAGLTGVELAGELADWCHRVSKKYGLTQDHLRITLVDGSPSVLAACGECQDRIIPLATELLKRKGIDIINGVRVQAIEPHRVVLNNGQALEAGLIVWTGGVRGHELLEQSGLALQRQKRAVVNEYLQARDHPEVFVIGDSAAATVDGGATLPPTAQVAIHQGPMVAENFHRLFSCQTLQACEPKMMGIFLSLGHKDALGVVQNKYHFSGWMARTIKNAIGYRYLAGLGGWKLVWAKLRKATVAVRALPPKHHDVQISLWQRAQTATVAGLLGTAALTALSTLSAALSGMGMDVPAMLSGFLKLPLSVGWLVHVAIGVMLAWTYALLFCRTLPGRGAARGALFGLLPFITAETVVLPMMGAGLFSTNMGGAALPAVGLSLLSHLLYGAVVGWVLSHKGAA